MWAEGIATVKQLASMGMVQREGAAEKLWYSWGPISLALTSMPRNLDYSVDKGEPLRFLNKRQSGSQQYC